MPEAPTLESNDSVDADGLLNSAAPQMRHRRHFDLSAATVASQGTCVHNLDQGWTIVPRRAHPQLGGLTYRESDHSRMLYVRCTDAPTRGITTC